MDIVAYFDSFLFFPLILIRPLFNLVQHFIQIETFWDSLNKHIKSISFDDTYLLKCFETFVPFLELNFISHIFGCIT